MQPSLAAQRRGFPFVAGGIVALLMIVAVLGILVLPSVRTPAQPSSVAANDASATVARQYFEIFNAGVKSGDFSALASVMAPDIVLTKSDPQGHTSTFHGLTEVMGMYQTIHQNNGTWQWTTDDLRVIAPNVVVLYEHAGSPPLTVASRCFHVMKLENGKIKSYDWTAFFAGQK